MCSSTDTEPLSSGVLFILKLKIFSCKTFSTQVIHAARILSSRPKSKVAQENMAVFRSCWEAQLQILTDAVDDIVTLEDFLAVSESHILEDVNRPVI